MQEDDEEYETPVHVNPRTNSPEYDSEEIITTLPSSFETGATTIILPVISPVSVKTVNILRNVLKKTFYKMVNIYTVLAPIEGTSSIKDLP